MIENIPEVGTNQPEMKLSRRALLGLGVAAGVKAILGPMPALAAPEHVVSPQTGLPSQEVEKTQVPLPTPEEQVNTYGYEIGWENGPFGDVTLSLEKDLFERKSNWVHTVKVDTDPTTGFPDAEDRLNNGIRFGMYRGWQSNDPEGRSGVTPEDFNDMLAAGEDLSFHVLGKKGTSITATEIDINPADPVRVVWLSDWTLAEHKKSPYSAASFMSENGETRIGYWISNFFVPGNGDYGGDAEKFFMHKDQLAGSLASALIMMGHPDLQAPGIITPELDEKYKYSSQPATEMRDFFLSFDLSNPANTRSILSVI